jgi:hypothetical protein
LCFGRASISGSTKVQRNMAIVQSSMATDSNSVFPMRPVEIPD